MLTFLLDILLFSLLAWYFDHVDDSNRGKNYSKLFFLEKSYWFPKKELLINDSESSDSIVSSDTINTINNDKKETNNNYNIIVEDPHIEDRSQVEIQNSIGLKTFQKEKERIMKAIEKNKENQGLRVLGLSKQYLQGNCCKTNIVDALKTVFFKNLF